MGHGRKGCDPCFFVPQAAHIPPQQKHRRVLGYHRSLVPFAKVYILQLLFSHQGNDKGVTISVTPNICCWLICR